MHRRHLVAPALVLIQGTAGCSQTRMNHAGASMGHGAIASTQADRPRVEVAMKDFSHPAQGDQI